jgi:hypothetical protein
MFKGLLVRLSRATGLALIVVLLGTPIAWAAQQDDETSTESQQIQVRLVLVKSSYKPLPRPPQTNGAGGHLYFYIPNCTNPPDGAAYALFDVGPGPFTVQFHGNRYWVSGGACGAATCTYMAIAAMPSNGDWIWGYSVTAGWSSHISGWCASVV